MPSRRSRLFHVAEILGIDDEGGAELAPAEQHTDEASKLARRAVQIAGGPQIDSRISDGGPVGARVAARQRALVGRRTDVKLLVVISSGSKISRWM